MLDIKLYETATYTTFSMQLWRLTEGIRVKENNNNTKINRHNNLYSLIYQVKGIGDIKVQETSTGKKETKKLVYKYKYW